MLPRNPEHWPEPWRHALAEREAIMQFDGGMEQEWARREAEADIRRQAAREVQR
jgi:hypothetical protein